jgi:Pentapeptide repeats (8 copies)
MLILLGGAAIFFLCISIMFLIHKNSFGHLRERSTDPVLLIGFSLGWLVLIGMRIRTYVRQRSLSDLAEVIVNIGVFVAFVGMGLGSFPTRYLLLALAFFALAGGITLYGVGWFAERGPVREHLGAEELVKRYQAGRRDFRRADMFGVVLRGADLTGVDLSGSDLSGADLRGADLRGAVLKEIRLVGACLEEAKVTEAQLGEAESVKGAIMPDGSRHD